MQASNIRACFWRVLVVRIPSFLKMLTCLAAGRLASICSSWTEGQLAEPIRPVHQRRRMRLTSLKHLPSPKTYVNPYVTPASISCSILFLHLILHYYRDYHSKAHCVERQLSWPLPSAFGRHQRTKHARQAKCQATLLVKNRQHKHGPLLASGSS